MTVSRSGLLAAGSSGVGARSGSGLGKGLRGLAPLVYLDAAAVNASMPNLDERLELAERTMKAIGHEGELPPKIGVHPRPESSFGHAMPAHLRGSDGDGGADLLGTKWVVGFPSNGRLGLPSINATVILNDPLTGLPLAILDGGPITAQRTAAVSGVAIRFYAPRVIGRPVRVALIGAGIQGHSHVPVLGHVLPAVELAIFDRHFDRAESFAAEARETAGIGSARSVADAKEAVADADVVVTAASFGPVRQVMTNDWLSANALVVPIDYATYCAAEVARDAALFLVDDVGQFAANRDAGLFEGYPDPVSTLGDAIIAGTQRPERGRVVVTHLGVGLADVVFADAIVRNARERGLGVVLPR